MPQTGTYLIKLIVAMNLSDTTPNDLLNTVRVFCISEIERGLIKFLK